jgi:hypothetical protein
LTFKTAFDRNVIQDISNVDRRWWSKSSSTAVSGLKKNSPAIGRWVGHVTPNWQLQEMNGFVQADCALWILKKKIDVNFRHSEWLPEKDVFFAVQPFNFGRSRIKWLYRSETDYLSFELRMHEAIWVDPQRRVFIVISAEGSDSPLSIAQ